MARFDWFAWHRNYRTDEWIHSLSEAERWAWVAFLSYANETDFVVAKCNPDLLAPLLTVTPVTLRNMLTSAIKHGKILEDSGDWFVKNGDKYRVGVDKTASARMAKMREKQKLEQQTVTLVTRNTRNTPNSDVTCQDKDTNKDKDKTEIADSQSVGSPEPEPPPPPQFVEIVESWNTMASELGYQKIKPTLTDGRIKKLRTRIREPEFQFTEIMQAFRDNRPAITNAKGEWKPNFDFVIRDQTTYTRILEGEFKNNGKHSNGHKPVDTEWQEQQRERENRKIEL